MIQIELFPESRTVKTDFQKPVNVASVPQRSIFRYPGGKTWLVPFFRQWIKNLPKKPGLMIDLFAGGGSIGLTCAFENLAEKVLLVELDPQIASVWKSLLGKDSEWLSKQILQFTPTPDSIKNLFAKQPSSCRETAFQVIVRNRVSRGGILAAGAGIIRTGENGRGLLSRWYPQTLARRIDNLKTISNFTDFFHGDALDVLEKTADDENICFFIDPPYTAGGKRAGRRLYSHSNVNHEKLWALCEEIKGSFLMTYDDCEETRLLAKKHGFQVKSILMKNSHHSQMSELLVSKNLF
jgi:DNA adenine methylase